MGRPNLSGADIDFGEERNKAIEFLAWHCLSIEPTQATQGLSHHRSASWADEAGVKRLQNLPSG
jgi:hypothetical protein